ncbi:RHS repeat protein, partial [Candidatus Saccharibacteria bacterium]|nr:RHS repeat protein [Candidatus Saccharibacteria bacterium]
MGGVTAQYYDNAGRVIAVVAPLHFDDSKTLDEMTRTEYLYDALGRVVTVTQIYFDDRDATWKSFVEKAVAYDSMNNATKELDAMGYSTGTGDTIAEKIATGYGMMYTYNLAGMRVTELDPESAALGLTWSMRYTYDALGRLILTENIEGTIARTEYDLAGNVVRQTVRENASAPEQTILTATYDFAGNVLTQTDANGYTVTNTYNALNQLRSTTMPGDASIPSVTATNQYNRSALVSSSWSTAGVLQTYTYDNLGHLLSLSKS